jgi:tetratricopeptide (TPR) repeat protein
VSAALQSEFQPSLRRAASNACAASTTHSIACSSSCILRLSSCSQLLGLYADQSVDSNLPLKPPNDAARRLAYESALKHLNEVVPVPQPVQLSNGPGAGQEELALAPLTRNPAEEAAKAAREAMAGGNYVRAVGCLRRALSLNRDDRALKDMLKSAEAQCDHREWNSLWSLASSLPWCVLFLLVVLTALGVCCAAFLPL